MSKHNLGKLTANGSTIPVRIYNTRRDLDDKYTTHVVGTFGTGTVTIETSPDGINFTSVGSNGVFTENGQADLSLMSDAGDPLLIQATLSGSAGSDVDIFLYDVR